MTKSRILVVVAVLFLSSVARAERSALPSADELDTPKKALTYFDHVGTDPHVDRATLFYHSRNNEEKKVAKAFASVDLELAKLRKAATARFDDAAGNAMVHALRDVTSEDIEAAKETFAGNKAEVSGKRFSEPLPMVKVNGQWKISIAECIAQSQSTADDLISVCEDLVDAMQQTEQELMADKFANPSLLERVMKRRVRALVGDE